MNLWMNSNTQLVPNVTIFYNLEHPHQSVPKVVIPTTYIELFIIQPTEPHKYVLL